MGTLVLHFTHVKRTGNKVADVLANKGVRKNNPFHAEVINDKKEWHTIWRRCEELAEEDVGRMEGDHPR